MSAGHIRPRGPGAWELKYDVGRDPKSGRRITRYKTVRGRKADAQRELRNLLGAVDKGVVADAGKMTTAQWLEQWLAECKHTVAAKTWQERDRYVRLHLIPALGTILLAKLCPTHIQNYYTTALSSGRLDGKGGLSPQTVRHHDRVLHTALDRARRLRLIGVNPVDDVDPPHVEHAEMVVLSPAEQAELLAAAAGTALYLPVLLALATGVRRGELLGLAWPSIDLDAGVVHIVQVVEQTRGQVRIKPQPKTKRGRRTIALPVTVVDALRQYRVAQLEEHLKLGLGRPSLLFARWAANPAVCGTAFTRLAARVGIKASLHCCRHTHITDLLKAGVHPKVVSERAGHSSVAFTLDRYAHVLPGMQEAAAEHVDAALRQALGGKRVATAGAGLANP